MEILYYHVPAKPVMMACLWIVIMSVIIDSYDDVVIDYSDGRGDYG